MNEEVKNIAEKTQPKNVCHTNQLIFKKGEHPKITELIVMMLSSNLLPFYAEFSTCMNYFEASNVPSCGVNVGNSGMNFYWNRKFVDSLPNPELLFVVIHENFHLLFDHTKRSIFYNKELSNIAQDMIINTILNDDLVNRLKKKNDDTSYISIPKHHDEFLKDVDGNDKLDSDGNKIKNPYYNQNMGLFIDKEYTGEPIFENLYEWLKNKQDNYKERKEKQQGKGQGNGQQDGQGQGDKKLDSFGNPAYGPYGQGGVECSSLDAIFDSIEKGEQLTLDTHFSDDVSKEARKSIVGDFVQRMKMRGLITGDIEATLKKLKQSKKNYLKEIKREVANNIIGSTKIKSIMKPNRRGIEGIKGKKKIKNAVNCVLDTSGSMSGDFDHVLSYLYQNDVEVNLIQIDTTVKAFEKIKSKKQLQKLTIKGLGGTTLQPALDYLAEPKNKLIRFNNLVLTDGATDTLNFSNVNGRTLILTTGKEPNIIDPKGKVKIIIIDLKDSIYGN